MPSNHLPNLSNNPYLTGMDHNSMESKLFNVNSNKNSFKTTLEKKKLNSVDLLQGSREKSPESVNSAYWSFF